jgi:hypothetical protein
MLLFSDPARGAAILILWDKVNAPDATTNRLAPVNMTGPYWTMLQGLMGDVKTKGIKRSDVTGIDVQPATSFDATKPRGFNSVGWPTMVAGAAPPNNVPYGGIFKNKTGRTIGDIHIDLLRAGDTIDPRSKTDTEKGAFSNVTISANQRSIDFA